MEPLKPEEVFLVKQNGAPQRLAYRLSDLVDAVGLSDRTLRTEIQTGKLIARKCGSATLVLHDDVVAWLKTLPRVN
jgi:hypothetical protein